MIVKLIAYTPEPDKLCGMAAALCTGQDIGNDRVCESALRGALRRGHESVAEHACFSFLVEGVSRVTLAQLTRHRIASFSVESQRYVKGSGREAVVPVRIAAYPDLAARFESLAEKAALFYADCLERGILSEDARYGLLQAGTTRLVMTMNARELRHFFSLRCCNRAQWEIRSLADEMLLQVKPVAPVLFENAGPGCVAKGACPEGDGGCALPRKRGEWDE